jgi:hypothetical protein
MQKPPSGDSYATALLLQNMQRQNALAAEQAAYSQQLEEQRSAAAASVAAQQAALDASIKQKIGQPVKMGTLMTSASGLLGNPVLSATKLSG